MIMQQCDSYDYEQQYDSNRKCFSLSYLLCICTAPFKLYFDFKNSRTMILTLFLTFKRGSFVQTCI